MRIGFVVNDIKTEWPDYTTTHLAMTAANMGHEVWYMGLGDLSYGPDDNTHAHARMAPPKVHRSSRVYLEDVRGHDAIRERITLEDLDVLMLRNDPAQDVNKRPWARLAGINFGRLAMRHGVIVLNDPNGLMHAVNKMYLQYFPEAVRPHTLITRNTDDLKAFVKDHAGWAVLKPLSGSGGRNVFLITPEEANVNQIMEAVCSEGFVMAQEFVPQARQGDTRLFLMNGQPLRVGGKYAALRRVRREGEVDIRANMTAGAIAEPAQITDTMLRLAELVRPRLVQDGMFFVGLDIVDDKLMEINVFSAGGLFSAVKFAGVNFYRELISALERKVAYAQQYNRHFDHIQIATL